MNEALTQIAIDAGAPEDMLYELWFHTFCQNFAHLILLAAEGEM